MSQLAKEKNLKPGLCEEAVYVICEHIFRILKRSPPNLENATKASFNLPYPGEVSHTHSWRGELSDVSPGVSPLAEVTWSACVSSLGRGSKSPRVVGISYPFDARLGRHIERSIMRKSDGIDFLNIVLEQHWLLLVLLSTLPGLQQRCIHPRKVRIRRLWPSRTSPTWTGNSSRPACGGLDSRQHPRFTGILRLHFFDVDSFCQHA